MRGPALDLKTDRRGGARDVDKEGSAFVWRSKPNRDSCYSGGKENRMCVQKKADKTLEDIRQSFQSSHARHALSQRVSLQVVHAHHVPLTVPEKKENTQNAIDDRAYYAEETGP